MFIVGRPNGMLRNVAGAARSHQSEQFPGGLNSPLNICLHMRQGSLFCLCREFSLGETHTLPVPTVLTRSNWSREKDGLPPAAVTGILADTGTKLVE